MGLLGQTSLAGALTHRRIAHMVAAILNSIAASRATPSIMTISLASPLKLEDWTGGPTLGAVVGTDVGDAAKLRGLVVGVVVGEPGSVWDNVGRAVVGATVAVGASDSVGIKVGRVVGGIVIGDPVVC